MFLKNQNNTEIFYFLILLPCCSSTFRQTNDDNTRNVAEDYLGFSRIQSLHHCLEVGFHDEEDGSISSTLENRIAIVFLVQHRSKFFPHREKFLWMSQQNLVFVGFALAFDRLAKSHILRTAFLRFSALVVQVRDQLV